MSTYILGIESSCDDTSAAVIKDRKVLSNIIANQDVHKNFGGVVPELASRAHQQNIIPVVNQALSVAGIDKTQLDGVAFTRGPGLLGSLLVGSSFAKGFTMALNIPLIDVNHLQAHVMAHFLEDGNTVNEIPKFPFICLLVSGGHTQLVLVKDFLEMEIIGRTIDDAAGEAFDKCAKVMGLPYPGGPVVDKLASGGNPDRFSFNKPRINGLDYSFSGLKTSFLYFLRDQLKINENFIKDNEVDLCAGLQKTIIEILLDKLLKASDKKGIKNIALAGGVSANSGLRKKLTSVSGKFGWNLYLPAIKYTTDNAAMIAIAGYYKYQRKEYANQDIAPMARLEFQ